MPRSVGLDHFFDGFIAARKDQVHRRFAIFVRQREAVAGRLGFHFFRGGARIDQILRHAPIDQQNLLARDAFPVVRRAALQRMIGVVPDGDVVAENFLADAAGEARALIEHGRGGEIVEEKSDQIEHRGRTQDRGVAAGGNFARLARACGRFRLAFSASSSGSILRISGEFDLAQPEEFASRMVTENSARVCS